MLHEIGLHRRFVGGDDLPGEVQHLLTIRANLCVGRNLDGAVRTAGELPVLRGKRRRFRHRSLQGGTGDEPYPSRERYCVSSRTGTPVGPGAYPIRSFSLQATPAMSRWTQGVSPANSFRKYPAVIVPASGPPIFLRSPMSLLICSKYSSCSGSSHAFSPDAAEASRILERSRSSFPIIPIVTLPSATTHAPVSVAASTIATGR